MILEHAILAVRPGREAHFEAAFAEAKPIIAAAPGFIDLTLSRSIETPNEFLLLVHWESVEAHEEGFEELATMFENIAKVEAVHEKRYRELAKNVEDGTVFAKGGKLFWKCRNCGAIFELDKAPDKCPVCNHPQAYFEIQAKNW